MNRFIPLALLSFLPITIGCAHSYFDVRVRDRRAAGWIEGANVALHDDRTCTSGPLSQGYTDADGMVTGMSASHCGPGVLWVSADGYRPVVKAVDSCVEMQHNIVLSEPMPPEPQVDTPEVATARAFLRALDAGDHEAVAPLLDESSELFQYLPQQLERAVTARPNTCPRRFSRVLPGSETRVEFVSICEAGCQEAWRVVLISREGRLRVHALERVSE